MAYAGFDDAAGARLRTEPPPKDRAARMVVRLVSRECRVHVHLILDRDRGRARVAKARQLAMYLTHVMLGRSLSEVGRYFGRDRSTVSHACALMEDMRDDPRFEAEVSRLEDLIEIAREMASHGR